MGGEARSATLGTMSRPADDVRARTGAASSVLRVVLCMVAVGCAGAVPMAPAQRVAVAASVAASVASVARVASVASVAVTDVVLVSDPAALAPVVAGGGSLGALVGGVALADADNQRLGKSRFRSVADTLAADLAALVRADAKLGVGVRGNAHRLFDARWLHAANARFDLIGVAHRLDRAPFSPGACGETRLLYRLAYEAVVSGEAVRSRLPMTLAVVLHGPPRESSTGCRDAARAWQAPAGIAGAALGRWLVGANGPLRSSVLDAARVDRIEVNLQSVRWPSAVRPDLGGHAEYLLRVFRAGVDARAPFTVAPLTDTPDVARIRKSPALRKRLLAWVRDNLAAIDAGTGQLPDELAASRAISVAPRGWSRRANRPYRQLLAAADLADLDLAPLRHARSPEALLRRLDDLTCQGCHQARTIAGFHLVGEDPSDVAPGNALAVSRSVHLVAEVARRSALAHAVAAGAPADYARPFAERGTTDPGANGAHCGLGDPGFAAWTCAPGLACVPHDAPADDAHVGVCHALAPHVGDPCEVLPLTPRADPHRDRTARPRPSACSAGAVCNTNAVGFPGGMCTESCADLSPDGVCGVIAALRPFNDCLARKTPFPRCLAEHVFPAGLRSCDELHACRDDYLCARTPNGKGACIPPYFLFQMRVDGHP